jgi:hypothetical protein
MKKFLLSVLSLIACTGPQGSQGIPGSNGKAGVGLVETSIPATVAQCPYGGYNLLVAQDTVGTGVWESCDADQTEFSVCDGATGAAGATGSVGQSGSAGAAGSSCSVSSVGTSAEAPTGGTLISCTNGTEALVLNGLDGTNGTFVQPVQFCPGNTIYPNEFNELGFCIQGSLYAVYSLNNGFLSLIPPGRYDSDAVGSSCDFTVGTNCTISDN